MAGSDQRVAEQPLDGKSVSHFQKMSRENSTYTKQGLNSTNKSKNKLQRGKKGI